MSSSDHKCIFLSIPPAELKAPGATCAHMPLAPHWFSLKQALLEPKGLLASRFQILFNVILPYISDAQAVLLVGGQLAQVARTWC